MNYTYNPAFHNFYPDKRIMKKWFKQNLFLMAISDNIPISIMLGWD